MRTKLSRAPPVQAGRGDLREIPDRAGLRSGGARSEARRRLLGVGSSAWFGVQGGNRVQRAALLPSGCFSLYASYFPVE